MLLTANTLMVSLLLLVLLMNMCGVMQLDIARVLLIEVTAHALHLVLALLLFIQDHHYCESGQ